MAPDDSILNFVKDYLWAPITAAIGWHWTRNVKEHDDMRSSINEARKEAGVSHSVLMDRIVTHVDESVKEAVNVMKDEDRKISEENGLMRNHITKLFENAERDRSQFRDMLMLQMQRSDDRHAEILKGHNEIMRALHEGLAKKADK